LSALALADQQMGAGMRYAWALLMVLALVGCGAQQVVIVSTPTPEPSDCTTEAVQAYAEQMGEAIADYQEQAELTGTVSRVSIAAPLQRLLDLKNDAEDVEAPECVAAHQARTVAAMDAQQAAFQDFAAQRGEDAEIGAALLIAQVQLERAAEALEPMGDGVAPTPAPTAEAVSPPEPGVVSESTLLMIEPDSTGVYALCPSDRFQVVARSGEWVQVRITKPGAATDCTRVLAVPAEGVEGWLRDADVFAPGSAPAPTAMPEPTPMAFPFAAIPNGARRLADAPDSERTGGRMCSTAQLEVIERQEVGRIAWYRVEVVAVPECALSEPRAVVGDTGWLAEGDFLLAP
jgi:hypothetical protein